MNLSKPMREWTEVNGTKVRLTDEEWAFALELHRSRVMRPKVVLVSDDDKPEATLDRPPGLFGPWTEKEAEDFVRKILGQPLTSA